VPGSYKPNKSKNCIWAAKKETNKKCQLENVSEMCPVTCGNKSSTVLILGAGAAGLAAAYQLQQQGITNFLIVEAADRLGGRMKNLNFAERSVQEGAAWVQGTEGSWLWELVKESGVNGHYSDFDNVILPLADDDKYYGYYEQLADAWEREEETLECMTKESNEMRKTGESDISSRQAQKLCGWSTFQDKFSELVEWWTFDYEFADAPVTTSHKNAWPVLVYEIYQDEDYEITDSRGWLPIFDLFNIPSSKILLNSKVTQIKYDVSGATVVVMQTGINGTDTEISLKADYVICTFSFGVLQSDHKVLFDPPLPDWYLRELYKFDMNTYTKIYMHFPSNFWGDEEEFFMYADEIRGYYPVWQNMGLTHEDPDYNVLMVVVTGMEAMRIAQQTDEETKAEAMDVLKTMFGSEIPGCLEIHVPGWINDPLYRGSYSNWPIGTTKMDHVELGTPITERLYLRGEGTSPDSNGWVHGALNEGRQVAKEIKSCIDDPYGGFCKCANDRACSTYDVKKTTKKSKKSKKSKNQRF